MLAVMILDRRTSVRRQSWGRTVESRRRGRRLTMKIDPSVVDHEGCYYLVIAHESNSRALVQPPHVLPEWRYAFRRGPAYNGCDASVALAIEVY